MPWGEKCCFVKRLKEFNLFPGFRNLRFPLLELYPVMVPSIQHFPLSLRGSRTLGAMASLTGILREAATIVFPLFFAHWCFFFIICHSVSCDLSKIWASSTERFGKSLHLCQQSVSQGLGSQVIRKIQGAPAIVGCCRVSAKCHYNIYEVVGTPVLD